MIRSVAITVVSVVAAIQAGVCLFVGVPCVFSGLSWFLLDTIAIVTGGGGNLTGLGIIFGLPMTIIGMVYMFGFVSSVLLLKLHSKGLKYTLIFLILATMTLTWGKNILMMSLTTGNFQVQGSLLFVMALCYIFSIFFLMMPSVHKQLSQETVPIMAIKEIKVFIVFVAILGLISARTAVQGNISWNNQLARERQKRQRWEDEARREDLKILKMFETNPIVCVAFSLRYADDHEARRRADDADIETRGHLNKKFAIEKIIEPIGKADMPGGAMTKNTIDYQAKVTKSGYEKLKQNKYVCCIELWNDTK